MNYTLVRLHNYPVVSFAHNYNISKYLHVHPEDAVHFEFTYISAGAVTRKSKEQERIIPEYSVCVHVPGKAFLQASETHHSHSTVGILVECDIEFISKEEVLGKFFQSSHAQSFANVTYGTYPEFILPDEVPPGEGADAIHRLISDIIHTYQTTEAPFKNIITCHMALSLFVNLTQICVNDILKNQKGDISPSYNQYVKKFKRYVIEHINEDITCGQIADELSVTPTYLSAVVKKVTGETVINFINRYRLSKMLEFYTTYQITMRQAGEMVGIHDPYYLSRMFKKYYGVSLREYLKFNPKFESKMSE